MSRIKTIMNNSNMITCEGCKCVYLPFSDVAEEICPLCSHDHLQDVRELMRGLEDVDSYTEDSRGLTGYFEPVEVLKAE